MSKETKRKTFTKAERNIVWSNYFNGKKVGPCPGCRRALYDDNFEVCHIISLKEGGTNELSNLIPGCRQCNRSCATQNFEEYTKKFRSIKTEKNYIYKITASGAIVEVEKTRCIIL